MAGLGGLPQLSLPLATLGGMPLGLSLVAGRGKDELLLAVARAITASEGDRGVREPKTDNHTFNPNNRAR